MLLLQKLFGAKHLLSSSDNIPKDGGELYMRNELLQEHMPALTNSILTKLNERMFETYFRKDLSNEVILDFTELQITNLQEIFTDTTHYFTQPRSQKDAAFQLESDLQKIDLNFVFAYESVNYDA